MLMPHPLSHFPNSLSPSVQYHHISSNMSQAFSSPLVCDFCYCTCSRSHWKWGHSWWEVWHQCGVSTQPQLCLGFGPQLSAVLLSGQVLLSWSGFQCLVPVEVWWRWYQGTLWQKSIWWAFLTQVPQTQPFQPTAWSCLCPHSPAHLTIVSFL